MINNENQIYTSEISTRLKHMEMEIIKLAPSVNKYITNHKYKIMAFLIHYTKLAYLDNTYLINMKIFDKLIGSINVFNVNTNEFNLLKAYYYHNCFRQTQNEKFQWHSFLCLQYLHLKSLLLKDSHAHILYDNLLKWFQQKNIANRLNIQNNNRLFANNDYGTTIRRALPSENTNGIVKIPKEILMIIMSFLPLKDALSLCMLNKTLYRVHHDIQLWDQLELSQMMTDINYLNHCYVTPNFYLLNSQQRIRYFYAKSIPPHTFIITTNETNFCMKDLLMSLFKIIVGLGILGGLTWCSYFLYKSWSDNSISLINKIGESIVPLAIFAVIGACGGSIAGLVFILMIMGIEYLIKCIHSSQINARIRQRNIQNEQLQIHLENIVHTDYDIESQTNNSTPTETDRILTVRY